MDYIVETEGNPDDTNPIAAIGDAIEGAFGAGETESNPDDTNPFAAFGTVIEAFGDAGGDDTKGDFCCCC